MSVKLEGGFVQSFGLERHDSLTLLSMDEGVKLPRFRIQKVRGGFGHRGSHFPTSCPFASICLAISSCRRPS